MSLHIDSCSLTVRYPALDRVLDESVPGLEVPPYHRWVASDDPWEQLVELRDMVAPADRAAVIEAGRVVADLVEYGLLPAEAVARREFPEDLEAFCTRIWQEAFHGAPAARFRLVCLDFAGPLWACAGAVMLAARRSLLVALKLSGRYRAVASRDSRVRPGDNLEIHWTEPAIQEFRPTI